MVKMTRTVLIFNPLFLILFLFLPGPDLKAQNQGPLEYADSLYNHGKYTQALESYKDLLSDTGSASPAMLLKMAFIEEGLEDYGSALYYLNLYYLQTFEEAALQKMENLAKRHHLRGYEQTDSEYFTNFYFRYSPIIIAGIIGLAVLVFGILYYQKSRLKRRPTGWAILLVGLYACLFYLTNFGLDYQRGVLTGEYNLLRDAPSSASQPQTVAGSGHRVKVVGKKDTWIKVLWEGEEKYVRESQIKIILL